MSVSKADNNTYTVRVRYKDYTGKSRQKKKTGFTRRKDALDWERAFLERQTTQPDIMFSSLCEKYLADKEQHTKPVPYKNKSERINKWILPAFQDRQASEITPADIRAWQTDLRAAANKNGNPLSEGTLYVINSNLSSIFNYGVKYCGLSSNPLRVTGLIGSPGGHSLKFWTPEQFNRFIATFKPDNPRYALVMTLYYTGARIGEVLALTPPDIADGRVLINKNYQRIKRQDVIQTPKTANSVRSVVIPETLETILHDHISRLYGVTDDTRLFFMTSEQGTLTVLKRHAEKAGVPVIRTHDLRHSHASLLIDMGCSPVLISQRLGHRSVTMTLNIYSHLFESRQTELAGKLEAIIKENGAEMCPK